MLTKEQLRAAATIRLRAEQSDIPVRGNAMVSGDSALDKQVEDEIIARLGAGDIWAWANVLVTAEWHGLTGTDSLGGCSYKDEADFIQNSGYYDDMVSNAIDELYKQYETIVNEG